MRLTALPQYKRDTARFLEITGTLAKFGLAEHLERIEPDFLQRWLGHENIEEVARLGLGERVRLACEALGPTFVKLGQILSTRPDLIPLDVAQELERLQSRAPAD
jgi:ubiquinone biosynthesis protein